VGVCPIRDRARRSIPFQRSRRSVNPATALPENPLHDTVASATKTRRKRGPSLSRRIGQKGSVFQQGQSAWNPQALSYGRYWYDTPLGRRRRVVSLGNGLTRAAACRKLHEHIQAAGVNKTETLLSITSPGQTFCEQAEVWLASLPTRRRHPVKPATVCGWRHQLDKWILPTLGSRHLSEVGNGALRELIDVMTKGGLSPKTIVNYSQVPKMVVASALNADGEPLYPRTWNNDFIGLPIVRKEEQYRPTITEMEVNEVLKSNPRRESVLFALLAGTGLRAGEVLALKSTDFSGDFRVLHVSRSVWKGREQAPKTPAAIRDIDIAEPLAAVVQAYSEGRTGLLFTTRSGRPLSQRNVHRAAGHALHAFRRFRTEVLRRARVPEDLIGMWLGHTRKTVTDLYADGLKNDLQWRREWCEKVGLGFSVGLFGAINQTTPVLQEAA